MKLHDIYSITLCIIGLYIISTHSNNIYNHIITADYSILIKILIWLFDDTAVIIITMFICTHMIIKSIQNK